ncbi:MULTISPECIES: 30S ribosomal protein S21 [unclassified Burkholderia]|uniref:30S ribosomal protein S21 n=1 Tax=unclassified Burkholderia TaxID=2613784 RepID=UPI00084C4C41|nr:MULTISPECIES: 30S ribosomal protein S21 [unclassified Burkholderia]RQU17528.1 30S ribosomal protein S21 [Burkholderia cenocepacia]MBR8235660.1 30S ribosomal protein S21 [Burkholderia sp. AU32357]MBY4872014.1 30S ribosomal protein S21 [Burkholderia sp. AU42008]OED11472.1 30S ribosomal protein S21 [Burkholderia sp. A2]OXI38079.1 30S ribosomal protein S21 [Burkholderia sp. AU17457]
MTTITPKLNEPIDVTLRRFRRDIEKIGLIRELRSRTSYEKPTTERKRKKASAVARQRLQAKRLLPPRKMY